MKHVIQLGVLTFVLLAVSFCKQEDKDSGGGRATSPSPYPCQSQQPVYLANGDTVKSIIDRHCISCHRVGGSRANSPMDSEQGILQWKTQIASRIRGVGGAIMPPAPAQLTIDEKNLMLEWENAQYANGSAFAGSTSSYYQNPYQSPNPYNSNCYSNGQYPYQSPYQSPNPY
jgi:hypothetical protein